MAEECYRHQSRYCLQVRGLRRAAVPVDVGTDFSASASAVAPHDVRFVAVRFDWNLTVQPVVAVAVVPIHQQSVDLAATAGSTEIAVDWRLGVVFAA